MGISNELNVVSVPNPVRGMILPFGRSGGQDAVRVEYSNRMGKRIANSVANAAAARAAVEQAALAATEAVERARFVAKVLDEALAVLAEATSTGPRSVTAGLPYARDLLSPRECEVLSLVVAGHSNKGNAEALFVSPNTIKSHVASILHKMHVASRVQLAAMVARHEAVGRMPLIEVRGSGNGRQA